jgi:hypothetical protein
MKSVSRLQMIARVTYYLGWFSAVLAALAHFGLGGEMFLAARLPQRNLFEATVLFFLISAASAVRALVSSKSD